MLLKRLMLMVVGWMRSVSGYENLLCVLICFCVVLMSGSEC